MNKTQEKIRSCIVNYFKNEIINGCPSHGSYLSWEHCFSFFQNKNKYNPDLSALNLAFYLASWGMYRGSAKIRNYDYKIHTPAVDIIYHTNIPSLFVIDEYSDGNIYILFSLHKKLCEYYQDKVGKLELLITKILLGTLGCTPAYDTYLKKALTELEIKNSFSEINFKSIVAFCKNNSGISDAQSELLKLGHHYPIMRIFDIYCHSIARP